MESITDTKWDVLIAGTGLPQSLLALALSRSDKKVLHVDKNDFYGGADAALTLQDAVAWVQLVNAGNAYPYKDAHIGQAEEGEGAKLGYSRSYSLALSPQIIYTRSALLPSLVSSKVYRQLEFLAVGSWFVYDLSTSNATPSLRRIPSSREDVFADKGLDMKSKRSLISLLRAIRDPAEQAKIVQEHGSEFLSKFLQGRYKLDEVLQSAVAALTLSPGSAAKTTVAYALPRIERHMASIGVFGPGFGAVVPKWGGLAEVAQVACRAQAVGGGTYMLGKGIKDVRAEAGSYSLTIDDFETEISAGSVFGSKADFPFMRNDSSDSSTSRSISIVATGLDDLFVSSSEGGPKPTVAVVCFPEGSLECAGVESTSPVYLMVHSSETGECPTGQCTIYASSGGSHDRAETFMSNAVLKLLAIYQSASDKLLWSLHFKQLRPVSDEQMLSSGPKGVHLLDDTSTDLAFSDEMLQEVRTKWQDVSDGLNGFMDFEDREVGAYDDEE